MSNQDRNINLNAQNAKHSVQSVKALNAHFKLHHRKLQCKDCGKFFLTPGSYKLHSYTHQDGQFECNTCKRTFAFKSKLDQHMYCHTTTRQYQCPETGCDKSFSHEHDLKKHTKSHSGEVHYCMHDVTIPTRMNAFSIST